LTNNLIRKYNKYPVHSYEEILRLKSLFKENIRLFVSLKDNEIIAGILLYILENTIHCQYMASKEISHDIGGLDYIVDFLINHFQHSKKYFDFGISNEQEGRYLNRGLIEFKEGFGARAVCHDFYRLEIK